MKSKKHIVIDARIRRSSTGRPVDRLLEHLQELDAPYRFTVLLAKGDEWRPSNIPVSRRIKVGYSRFPVFSFNPFQQILFAWQLHRLKPDLVHFTMTPQQPVLYFGAQTTFTHDLTMLKYARAGRLPVWLHSLRMHGYRFLLWQSHHKAKKILVPTQYVRDAVLKYHIFTQRKVEVTLEAAESPIKIASEAVEGIEKPFLLHVGSPFPHKNIKRLLKSFEKLREKHPDLTLVLAGKKEYYFNKLEAWAEKRNSYEHIRFTGFVSDAQLKWLYENAECYILPSLSEGFGLPGLEAMVHGCPLVSSDATCLPEVYGEATQYFDPYEVESLVRATNKVLSDDGLRKKLVEKGYSQAKKYSWKKMTEQTVAVFDEVLAEDDRKTTISPKSS